MPQIEKYNPPNCPSLLFFRAEAIRYFIDQEIIPIESGKIQAGEYNLDSRLIIPVNPKSIRSLKDKATTNPDSIFAVPKYAEQIKMELPLVHGHISVYPNHDTFSIMGINHPLQYKTYFTEINELDKKYHVDYDEDEKHFVEKYDTRIEFIRNDRQFDPIINGHDTWAITYPCLHSDGINKLYFIISVDGSNIKPGRENKGLKEIRRVARNKKSKTFQDLLNRMSHLHNEVKPFLDYCDRWSENHK